MNSAVVHAVTSRRKEKSETQMTTTTSTSALKKNQNTSKEQSQAKLSESSISSFVSVFSVSCLKKVLALKFALFCNV